VARGIAYIVYVLPVVVSFIIAGFVLNQILQEPDRELNMWPFEIENLTTQNEAIKILNIEKEYSTSTPVNVQVLVSNQSFDCGDLYITIFQLESASKTAVTQGGFFEQCFVDNNPILPIKDEFSETIKISGKYEIVAEMIDKNQKHTISSHVQFDVK